MKRKTHVLGLTLVGASLLAGTAYADPNAERSGIEVTAGPGMEEYVGHTMRHNSNLTGDWSVHTSVKVQKYVKLEAGYVGSASKVNAPVSNDAATLFGTTFEAIGRLSPMPDGNIQPYAFFGAAWRRATITGADFTTADSAVMKTSDDLFQIPLGAGIAYRRGALVGDARFTYRQTNSENLVIESDGNAATLDTWGVSAGLGYEF